MMVTIPIRTVSETNQREHWAKRHRRRKAQRVTTWAHLKATERTNGGPPEGAMRITMVRIAPRKLDTGNLAAAMKAPQDGVADWLGIDDGDERLTWHYKQERGKTYAVRVEIEA